MNYLEAIKKQINLALDNNKSNILIGENINSKNKNEKFNKIPDTSKNAQNKY